MTQTSQLNKHLSIGFIGAGRVAKALAQGLTQAGYQVKAVASRSASSSAALAKLSQAHDCGNDFQAAAEQCDLLFLTVPDDALPSTIAALTLRSDQAVVHCSGACEIAILERFAQQGAQIGGFHPLFLFAGLPDDAQRLRGCSITIEAKDELQTTLQTMVQDLHCQPLTIPAGQRALYHAGANYAASFVLCLLAEATRLWSHLGIAPEAAQQALWPLLKGTIASAESVGIAQALAGPISRGDVEVLNAHLHALSQISKQENPDLQPLTLYRELSQRAIALARERGRPDEAILMRLHTILKK